MGSRLVLVTADEAGKAWTVYWLRRVRLYWSLGWIERDRWTVD